MGKTKKRETKKRETKKRKKIQMGGRPKFIKMYAQHTNKGNVVYRFVYDDFDKEDQKKIFNKDRVYYSVKNDDSLIDEMKNQIDVLNEEVQTFFYKKPKSSNPDYKTIIIRNKNELQKIEIAQQIIKNMDSLKMTSTINYDDNTPGFITEYKEFIKDNGDALLANIEQKNIAKQMLNTPAFLNIIGIHYNFITTELPDDLDKLKEQMDSPVAPSSASSSPVSLTPSTPSACPSPPNKSRSITKRLKELLQSKSK